MVKKEAVKILAVIYIHYKILAKTKQKKKQKKNAQSKERYQ